MLSAAYYDAYVAPDFSKFKGAELDDLSVLHPEQTHWLYNFILNHDSVEWKPKYRAFIFNLLRRVHGAFDAYGALQQTLSGYRQSRRRVRDYFAALNHAEVCISFAGQAIELGTACHKLAKTAPTYVHATEADHERLLDFYRAAKNIHDMVHGSQFGPKDTLVFWFTEDGLHSRKRGRLLFAQLASVMRELARDAALLSEKPVR